MKLPHPPSVSLLPFQGKIIEETLHFLRTNEAHGVYHASEQGLGKTICTIVAANVLKSRAILVICPASVILNWVREFRAWSTTDKNFEYLPILHGNSLANIATPNVVVLSYDMAKLKPGVKALTSRKWDLLILDESHRLKNRKSLRAESILGKVWDCATYRIALSGTPITDSVVDAYSTFSKFLPSVFKNYYEFANAFANFESTPWGDKYYGIKEADKLKKIIRSRFFVRYTKDEVMKDLPPKIFTKIILPRTYALKVPETDEEVLQASVTTIVDALEKGQALPVVPVSLAGQRRQQAMKKLPPIIDFIENILEQNIPLVVFTYHKEVLQNLAIEFDKYNPVTISGDTSSKNRELAIRCFQEGKTNLFIGQMVAAGVGITLTRSSNCVFAELDWSAANVSQSCDRLHRYGAKYPVNIYYFSVQDSLEERIIDTVIAKTKVFNCLVERPCDQRPKEEKTA